MARRPKGNYRTYKVIGFLKSNSSELLAATSQVKINSRATSQYKIQLDVRICMKHDKAKRGKNNKDKRSAWFQYWKRRGYFHTFLTTFLPEMVPRLPYIGVHWFWYWLSYARSCAVSDLFTSKVCNYLLNKDTPGFNLIKLFCCKCDLQL